MMAGIKLSDELLRKHVDAAIIAGDDKLAASRTLGIPENTFRHRLEIARRRNIQPTPGIANPKDPKALAGQIRRLETELKHHEKAADQATIIKGVIGNMARQVETLDVPKWLVTPQNKPSAPGVPTLFISDVHGGESVRPAQINFVNEYSVRIMRDRFRVLIDSAVHLLQIISPKMDYPGIVIPLGGDMISGNIHDELTATNELNSMPAVLELFSILTGIITSLAGTFGRVFLPCVSGNHGRDTTKIWNKDRHATSFDWLLYRFLAKHFDADKRVTFFIPDGPDAYYKIYDHAYLLTHGDQFRGGDGVIGVMGPIIRGDHKKRSRNAQINMEYDTMLLGHFHQYVHHSRFIINGTLKGMDEYAWANNFNFEPPCQALWITHPRYGQTFRMPVYVDKQRKTPNADWVSVQR